MTDRIKQDLKNKKYKINFTTKHFFLLKTARIIASSAIIVFPPDVGAQYTREFPSKT